MPKHSSNTSPLGKPLKNPFKQEVKDIKIYEVAKHSQYTPNAPDPEHKLTGRVFGLI